MAAAIKPNSTLQGIQKLKADITVGDYTWSETDLINIQVTMNYQTHDTQYKRTQIRIGAKTFWLGHPEPPQVFLLGVPAVSHMSCSPQLFHAPLCSPCLRCWVVCVRCWLLYPCDPLSFEYFLTRSKLSIREPAERLKGALKALTQIAKRLMCFSTHMNM